MNLPFYLHKIKKEKHYIKSDIFFCIFLSLFFILASIEFTLLFKPLYYFDIQNLNIEHQSGFSKTEIVKNYDYIINYFSNPKEQEFELPSITYSKYGQIHFKEVKNIFNIIVILLTTTGIISILGLIIKTRRKEFYLLKLTASILMLTPTILLLFFIINFNKAFVVFHKIFFNNDYWEFDSKLDPIINILPQEFFLHAALLIVVLLYLSSIALILIHRKLKVKNSK